MRIGRNLIIIVAAIALSAGIYAFSGGRFIFFFLPLLLGLPFLRRRG